MFSVYDQKAEAYLEPFTAQTSGVAIRMFEQAANDQNHNFGKFAGDYTLFEVGVFDQDAGKPVPHEHVINHGCAITFIRNQPESEDHYAQA